MDLPLTINSAVAATRRQDFIAQAEADRMARRARGAGHVRRGRFLARFAGNQSRLLLICGVSVLSSAL